VQDYRPIKIYTSIQNIFHLKSFLLTIITICINGFNVLVTGRPIQHIFKSRNLSQKFCRKTEQEQLKNFATKKFSNFLRMYVSNGTVCIHNQNRTSDSQFAKLTTTIFFQDNDVFNSAALHHKSTCNNATFTNVHRQLTAVTKPR